MDDPGSTRFIVLIILLILSAFFSAGEAVVVSISKVRLRMLQNQKKKSARYIEKLVSDSEKSISAILFGNNFINIAATAISTSIILEYFDGTSLTLGIASVAITIVILIFGELTPKIITINNAEKVGMFIAFPLWISVVILWPATFSLTFLIKGTLKILRIYKENPQAVTETELKTLVNIGHEEGVIEAEEKTMINNVFEFGDGTARDVMSPRTDVTGVLLSASFNDVMSIFHSERFSRLPVYKDDLDNITGILHLRDIAFLNNKEKRSFKVAKYMREPFFSYESKPAGKLFSEMREKSISIAVILDEHGGTSGILTLEDLIEEIVGEIYDEYDDAETDIEETSTGEYFVDGGMKIEDFNDTAGTSFVSDDYDSIGGFVMGLFDKIPDAGEAVSSEGVEFVIEEINKNRIEKLRVVLNNSEEIN